MVCTYWETEITISVVNGTQIICKFLELLFETSNMAQLKN